MLLDGCERGAFMKEGASEASLWWAINLSRREQEEDRWRTYLTPTLWKGSRLDTSLESTLDRSASGMSATGHRDVFWSWVAKARVRVLGRGSSWTCGRQRTLSTRKENRGVWIGVLMSKISGGKRKGFEIESSMAGILLHAVFSEK